MLAAGVMIAGVGVAGASTSLTSIAGAHVSLSKTHGHQPSRSDGVISAATGTSITVTNHKSSTTYAIGTATVVTERKLLVPASDLVVGARVQVVASSVTPPTSPVTAGSVVILRVPPVKQGHGVNGIVTVAPGTTAPTSFTVKSGNSTRTFQVTATTLVIMRGFAAPLSDVAIGARVRILPVKGSTDTAAVIEVFSNASNSANFVKGTVTVVTATLITIQNGSGTTSFTIDPTTLFVKGRLVILPANVIVGSSVRVLASTTITTTPPTAAFIALLSTKVAG